MHHRDQTGDRAEMALSKAFGDEHDRQRRCHEKCSAEYERKNRHRKCRRIHDDYCEPDDARGECDCGRPCWTSAVAQHAACDDSEKPGQSHQRKKVACEKRVDSAILRESNDVGRNKKVVESTDCINHNQQPEPPGTGGFDDTDTVLGPVRLCLQRGRFREGGNDQRK